MPEIAYGKHPKLEPRFKDEVIDLSTELGCDPSHLMAAMAFETGETFSPSVRNKLSGATGLIQFMPKTAEGLGTTTGDLALMTAIEQLAFVRKHFLPFKGKLQTLSDVYMTILFPVAVGKAAAHVLLPNPPGNTTRIPGWMRIRMGQSRRRRLLPRCRPSLCAG
jgi:hypothetical protein